MKNTHAAAKEQRNLYIGSVLTVLFALLMGSLIVYLYESEPNLKGQILKEFGVMFQDSAVSAHWQWDAENQPQMIMLVHYNDEGLEVDRRPVRMDYGGWPKVENDSAGCKKLWQMLLNQPMKVDGFLVRGEYYEGELVEDEPVNAYCRYRLSAGDYFDYAIYTGKVTFSE